MAKPYRLNVFEPGSDEDMCITFQSEVPFGAIARGDVLSRAAWPEPAFSGEEALRVVQVEHDLREHAGEPLHTVNVYTEAVPNTPLVRGVHRVSERP